MDMTREQVADVLEKIRVSGHVHNAGVDVLAEAIDYLRQPTPISPVNPDFGWRCTGCNKLVQNEHVTCAERHDPRCGGCDGICVPAEPAQQPQEALPPLPSPVYRLDRGNVLRIPIEAFTAEQMNERYLQGYRAAIATAQAAAGVPADGTCPKCEGSGDMTVPDLTRGPDVIEHVVNCDGCGGTGAVAAQPSELPPPALERGTKLVPYEERYFRSPGMAAKLGYTSDLSRFYSEEQMRAALAPAQSDSAGDARDAAKDVLAERERQKAVEGWTPEHDDLHNSGDMAEAAACYITGHMDWSAADKRQRWPWSHGWWKPKDRRRNLVRAAALLIAEIERIDRAASAAKGEQTI